MAGEEDRKGFFSRIGSFFKKTGTRMFDKEEEGVQKVTWFSNASGKRSQLVSSSLETSDIEERVDEVEAEAAPSEAGDLLSAQAHRQSLSTNEDAMTLRTNNNNRLNAAREAATALAQGSTLTMGDKSVFNTFQKEMDSRGKDKKGNMFKIGKQKYHVMNASRDKSGNLESVLLKTDPQHGIGSIELTADKGMKVNGSNLQTMKSAIDLFRKLSGGGPIEIDLSGSSAQYRNSVESQLAKLKESGGYENVTIRAAAPTAEEAAAKTEQAPSTPGPSI